MQADDIYEISILYLFQRKSEKLGFKCSKCGLLVVSGDAVGSCTKRSEKYCLGEHRLRERHFPQFIPRNVGAKREKPSRMCYACSGLFYNTKTGKRRRFWTSYWCPDCEKSLCITPCFEAYHKYVDFGKEILQRKGNYLTDENPS